MQSARQPCRWVEETNAPISQAEKLRPERGPEPGLLLWPEDSALRALPLHLLRQVTCESDSQVGPALPAVPGECDSSTFPVTHPSHPSSGQQAQSLGSHTPAFLTLPKTPCTSSSRESTLPPRRYQHFPPVTQRRSSTAEGGAQESWHPAGFVPLPQGITLAWPPSLGEEQVRQGQNAL